MVMHKKHIRHNLIQTINNTPNNIIDKIHVLYIVCAVSSITLKYLFLVITKITVMFQIVYNYYMQTLKYMLKIILLPDYYTINYLLMCNYFISFVFI